MTISNARSPSASGGGSRWLPVSEASASASEPGSSEVVCGAPLAGPPAVCRWSLMESPDAGSSGTGAGGSRRLPVSGACGSVKVEVAGANIPEERCSRAGCGPGSVRVCGKRGRRCGGWGAIMRSGGVEGIRVRGRGGRQAVRGQPASVPAVFVDDGVEPITLPIELFLQGDHAGEEIGCGVSVGVEFGQRHWKAIGQLCGEMGLSLGGEAVEGFRDGVRPIRLEAGIFSGRSRCARRNSRMRRWFGVRRMHLSCSLCCEIHASSRSTPTSCSASPEEPDDLPRWHPLAV